MKGEYSVLTRHGNNICSNSSSYKIQVSIYTLSGVRFIFSLGQSSVWNLRHIHKVLYKDNCNRAVLDLRVQQLEEVCHQGDGDRKQQNRYPALLHRWSVQRFIPQSRDMTNVKPFSIAYSITGFAYTIAFAIAMGYIKIKFIIKFFEKAVHGC